VGGIGAVIIFDSQQMGSYGAGNGWFGTVRPSRIAHAARWVPLKLKWRVGFIASFTGWARESSPGASGSAGFITH